MFLFTRICLSKMNYVENCKNILLSHCQIRYKLKISFTFFFSRHVKEYITQKCSIGDWFVLYQMSRNMNQRFFAEFLALLAKRAMEKPAAGTGGEFSLGLDDKPSKIARVGDFDLENDDIMDETIAAEARNHYPRKHPVNVLAENYPNAPFRSPSGRHLSASGSQDRVK